MEDLEYLTLIVLGGAINIKQGDKIIYAGEPRDFGAAWDSIEKEGWALNSAMVINPENKTYVFVREKKQGN